MTNITNEKQIKNNVNFEYKFNEKTINYHFSKSDKIILSDLVKSLNDEKQKDNINNQYIAMNKTVSCWKNNLTNQSDIQISTNSQNIKIYNISKKQNDKELIILKKTSIPTSYLIFLSFFLVLFFVTSTLLFSGLIMGHLLLDFGLNLLLIVGSLGMTITVIIAIYEWKCIVNEKTKQRRKNKSIK